MRRDATMVLTAAFLWGTTFPAVRFGLEEGGLDPYLFLFYRFLLATVALVGIGLALGRIRWALFLEWQIWMIAAANTVGYLLQFLAQERTTATKTSLLVNVNVLITVLLAWFVLRERFGRSLWWALLFGFAGVFLLSTNGDVSSLRLSNDEFVGDALAFGTGVCWSIIILAVKDYLNKHPTTDAVAMNVVVFSLTTLFALPLAASRGLLLHASWEGWATIGYLGLFSTTFAFLLWQTGLQTIPAGVSSVLLLFETVVALVLSVTFLGEGLTGWSAAGAALVLGAMYLASRPSSATVPASVGVPAAEPLERAP